MRTVSQIYEEYKIFPRLQMHMLRVGAVAKLINQSLDESLDEELLITACVLHDMGNIVKSDFKVFSDFSGQELEYWEIVKREFLEKYGKDDHEANAKILREIGINEKVVDLVSTNKFELICYLSEIEDVHKKILHYADGRVSPDGVLSYLDRMEEANRRYAHLSAGKEAERAQLISCGLEIEKQIFAKCRIKPEDITDDVVAPIIEELKNFVIK